MSNKIIHIYLLTEDVGNTTELTLEVNHHGHQIKAEVTSLKYNDGPVFLPKNLFRIEYNIEDGKIKMLNQFLTINEKNIQVIYDRNKDQAKIITDNTQEVYEGLVTITLQTWKGELHYQTRQIP